MVYACSHEHMKVPCAWFFTRYEELYSLMSCSRQYVFMTIIQHEGKIRETTHILTIYIRQSCNNQQSDEKVYQNFKMRNLHIFVTWFWSSVQHDQMPFGIFFYLFWCDYMQPQWSGCTLATLIICVKKHETAWPLTVNNQNKLNTNEVKRWASKMIEFLQQLVEK